MSRIINEMVPYLTVNPDHFYAALTAEIERPGDPKNTIFFEPLNDNDPIGVIKFDGTEQIMALDGQHRLKSIELAVEYQDIVESEVSGHRGKKNGIDKSQDIVYSSRSYCSHRRQYGRETRTAIAQKSHSYDVERHQTQAHSRTGFP